MSDWKKEADERKSFYINELGNGLFNWTFIVDGPQGRTIPKQFVKEFLKFIYDDNRESLYVDPELKIMAAGDIFNYNGKNVDWFTTTSPINKITKIYDVDRRDRRIIRMYLETKSCNTDGSVFHLKFDSKFTDKNFWDTCEDIYSIKKIKDLGLFARLFGY
jgi:hypothetical protein